jgi:hypothetical protein
MDSGMRILSSRFFILVDVAAILCTPSRSQVEDVWAWEPKKHGVYSVRSAYRLLDRTRIRNSDVNVASVSENEVWKKIWKLKVPPKIEFSGGELCMSSYCDVCGADEESIRHVLIECTVAQAFWEYAKELTSVKLLKLHPITWARDMLCGRAESEWRKALIIIGM